MSEEDNPLNSSILKLIEDELQHHFDISKAFHVICHHLKYEKVDKATLNEWINIYVSQEVDLNQIEYKYRLLIKEIYSKLLSIISNFVKIQIDSKCSKLVIFAKIYKKLGCKLIGDGKLCPHFIRKTKYPNFVKNRCLSETFRIIEQYYDEFLLKMIKNAVRQRKSRVEIFGQLYSDFKKTPVDLNEVSEWFERSDGDFSNQYLLHEIGETHFNWIKKISYTHRFYNNAICLNKNVIESHLYNVLWSHDSRYAFQQYGQNYYGLTKIRFKVLDLFHGQLKHFTVENACLNKIHWPATFKFVRFDENQLFVISYQRKSVFLFLINVNFQTGSCNIVGNKAHKINKKFPEYFIWDLICDICNSNSFAIIGHDEFNDRRSDQHCIFGNQHGNNLVTNDNEAITFGYNYKFPYLFNGKLCGLKLNYRATDENNENNVESVVYWRRENDTRDEFIFKATENVDFNNLRRFNCYKWSEDICFIGLDNGEILTFNIITQKCYSIFFGIKRHDFYNFIDQDYQMIVTNSRYIYHISLRKPESLLNLTWFNIRRQKMLFGSKVCDSILKGLPIDFKLQPFNIPISICQEEDIQKKRKTVEARSGVDQKKQKTEK